MEHFVSANGVALADRLSSLASFEPQDAPVVSLYLDLSPDQHGRDNYETFVRKAFAEQLKAFEARSAEHASLERDRERIAAYLADEVHRAKNGLALFASAAAGDFFEAVQLDAPLGEHMCVVAATPHLYPLARVVDQHPRYAVAVLDTHRARIFVFALNHIERQEELAGQKTRRSSAGGWSQARYQRRADNVHLHHAKEVADVLERIVRDDGVQHVVLAGDAVVIPLIEAQLSAQVQAKVVRVLPLAQLTPDDEVGRVTLEIMREHDAQTDAERVRALVDAWQGGGLGVVGPEATLAALRLGQVDELLISGTPDAVAAAPSPEAAAGGPLNVQTSAPTGVSEPSLTVADELVTRAHQTAAGVRFIEDARLLEPFGGAGAFLRFRI